MRLRNAAVAAGSALLLTLAVPTSAQAASGDFNYRRASGLQHLLEDPPSGVCIDLPGATGADPAHSPENFTGSTATVFLDFGCDGDTYYVMNPGKKLGTRLKLRSVIFS